MQLGVGKSRYFGRGKALFQVLLAATAANLTLVAGGVSSSAVSFVRQSLAVIATFRATVIAMGRPGALRPSTGLRQQPAT